MLFRSDFPQMFLEKFVGRDVFELQTLFGAEIADRSEGDCGIVVRLVNMTVRTRLIDHPVNHLHFAVQTVHGGDRHIADPLDFGEADDAVIASAQQDAEQRDLRKFYSLFMAHFYYFLLSAVSFADTTTVSASEVEIRTAS